MGGGGALPDSFFGTYAPFLSTELAANGSQMDLWSEKGL